MPFRRFLREVHTQMPANPAGTPSTATAPIKMSMVATLAGGTVRILAASQFQGTEIVVLAIMK